DRVVGQRSVNVDAVGAEIGGAPDGRRQHPGRRAMQQAVEPQVAVVAGEAERHPVGALNTPERRGRLELFAEKHPGHRTSRTSISGTEGASPAANAEPEMSRRSSANRTGTSNRKPARTCAPSAGAASKTTL